MHFCICHALYGMTWHQMMISLSSFCRELSITLVVASRLTSHRGRQEAGSRDHQMSFVILCIRSEDDLHAQYSTRRTSQSHLSITLARDSDDHANDDSTWC